MSTSKNCLVCFRVSSRFTLNVLALLLQTHGMPRRSRTSSSDTNDYNATMCHVYLCLARFMSMLGMVYSVIEEKTARNGISSTARHFHQDDHAVKNNLLLCRGHMRREQKN